MNYTVILVPLLTIVLLSSCSLEDMAEIQKIDGNELQTKSNGSHITQSNKLTSHRVSEKAARLYLHFLNDDANRTWSVTPFVADGDTLFYIFNSEKGWKIISGDTRTSPVLAESPKGNIIVSDSLDIPLKIIINDAKVTVQTIRLQETDNSSTSLWKPFIDIASRSSSETLSDSGGQRDTDFHWVKVLISSTSITDTLVDTGHLLSTTWDQDSPWNYKTPILQNHIDHCKVGCVAVAIGQLMFYFNSHYGYPTGLYENVWLDLQNYYYQPWQQIQLDSFNAISDRWDYMKLNRSIYGNDIFVADLLAYVGHNVAMNYGYSSSGTTMNQSRLSQFGFSSSVGYMPACLYSTVANILDGKPVVVDASTDNYLLRHTWIIDGYSQEKKTTTTTYAYYYVEDPSTISGTTYNGYLIVSFYDEEEMATLVPGYANGTQTYEYTESTYQYFYHNWGENDGQYDSIRQDVNYWHFGNNHFNLGRTVYYNLSYSDQ